MTQHNPECGLDCVSAGAVRIRTPLGKSSPRDLREYTPRLTFNWRCPECKSEWSGGVTTAYHCGVYAIDADEPEDE